MNYVNIIDLLSGEKVITPKEIDFLSFNYKGINFKAYGILHGLIGGTNQEYRDMVNLTIANSQGLKLGEKSMLKMYKGIDAELDDWLEVPLQDVFKMTLDLCISPLKICSIIKTLYKETTQKIDRFGVSGIKRLQDIGGSPQFHLINPYERRLLMGYPKSEDYMMENIKRRNGKGEIGKVIMGDPDWNWLTHIEMFANIPMRSIHMIEYAVHLATIKNKKEVCIFVGETHHTDIDWYVKQTAFNPVLEKEVNRIKARVNISNREKLKRKYHYLLASCAGAAIPIWSYMLLAIYLIKILKN